MPISTSGGGTVPAPETREEVRMKARLFGKWTMKLAAVTMLVAALGAGQKW